MTITHPFLSLARSGPHQFGLKVDNRVAVGRGDNSFLFGGAGLAASVLAMETASGQPALWATAQYLSYARPGSDLNIDCVLPMVGKYTTQARATIRNGETEILTAAAALGKREGMTDQWASFGKVPPPEDCEETQHWGDQERLSGRFRFRSADGVFADAPPEKIRSDHGRMLMWMRPSEDMEIDRIVLAVIADFVTPGIRNATGRRAGGNSLDNTIRYCAVVPTDWVLCAIEIEAIASGITHGRMQIFARTGELMATASQSMILRVRD